MRHGPHHEAQKSTIVILFLATTSDSFTCLPSSVGRVKSAYCPPSAGAVWASLPALAVSVVCSVVCVAAVSWLLQFCFLQLHEAKVKAIANTHAERIVYFIKLFCFKKACARLPQSFRHKAKHWTNAHNIVLVVFADHKLVKPFSAGLRAKLAAWHHFTLSVFTLSIAPVTGLNTICVSCFLPKSSPLSGSVLPN